MKAKHPAVQWKPIDREGSLWLICQAMKPPTLLTLSSLSLALVSCGSFKSLNQPISGSSDFNPLGSPGTGANASVVVAPTSPSYSPGQWVETSTDNVPFFSAIPQGNARADKVLPSGTPMKVVSNSGTYVRVEMDSGSVGYAVGYVPEIMIAERRSASEIPVTGPGAPIPDLGTVPPLVDPGNIPDGGIAPPPEVPGLNAPDPAVPSIPSPVPTVPAVPTDPAVPNIAPPPEVPGLTAPKKID